MPTKPLKTKRKKGKNHQRQWAISYWDDSNDVGRSLEDMKDAVVFLVSSERMGQRLLKKLRAEHANVDGEFRFGATKDEHELSALRSRVIWRLKPRKLSVDVWRRTYARQCEQWLREFVEDAAARIAPGTRKDAILRTLLEKCAVPPHGTFLSKRKMVGKVLKAYTYSDAFAELRRDLLVESRQQGEHGGYRLTDAGQARAQELKQLSGA
jgi:hypothetical protein